MGMTYFIIFGLIVFGSAMISIFATKDTLKNEYLEGTKIDVSVEKMREQERIIEDFLHENNLKKGAKIEEIAEVLKVREGGYSSDIKERAVLLREDINGYKYVIHKMNIPRKERVFDFAHECAHIINKDKVPATRPEGNHKAEEEQLADYTAAALLMPKDEVYNYLIANNYKKISGYKRLKLIKKLCIMYSVNEMVALRRVNEVFLLNTGM